MLAIARGLMAQPRLLMLDEPSLGLAPRIVTEILQVITRLNEAGLTVLLIEQNVKHSLSIADRGIVLENGRVVLADAGQALLRNEHTRRAYLGL
jgi:branched-chain amino acid transport system ATP-binding protein